MTAGTVTGAGGFGRFQDRIEAADVQEMGGKVVTASVRIYAETTSPSNYYIRVYKANATNDFSGQTLVEQSPNSGILATGNAVALSHTFTIPTTSCTTGLQIEIVAEYSGAAITAGSRLIIGDWQFSASSKLEPFELS